VKPFALANLSPMVGALRTPRPRNCKTTLIPQGYYRGSAPAEIEWLSKHIAYGADATPNDASLIRPAEQPAQLGLGALQPLPRTEFKAARVKVCRAKQRASARTRKIASAPNRGGPHRQQADSVQQTYFNAVETVEKVLFNWVPRPCTTAMIATAIPAAIRPYSMAVAPD
jgi:hypothetical protein